MRAVPRFSHSSDFSHLFSSDPQEVSDYAQGLLFIGCFLSVVFFLWYIVLLVLKCTPGAGFLSGRRFTNRTRATNVRVVFATAAVLSILFTILLVTEGITNLQDTLTTVDNSNQVRCFGLFVCLFLCCVLFPVLLVFGGLYSVLLYCYIAILIFALMVLLYTHNSTFIQLISSGSCWNRNQRRTHCILLTTSG